MSNCRLHSKLMRGLPLTDEEVKLLGNIIKEELKFLVRNNILPTPKNYEKWFTVFCFVFENKGKIPSDEELIEIYQSLHMGEKICDIKDVEMTLEVITNLMKDFQMLLKEHKEYASRKERELFNMESELSQSELTPLLLDILMHIKDIKAQNEKFLKKIQEQQHTIEELWMRLEKAQLEANIDYLTDTFNRRSFERALAEAFEEYKKRNTLFSLVLIDLDGFKKINDLYGHSVGDVVLKRVAHLFRRSLRAKDILARWGGDEFAVLMPGTRKEQAKRVAERLKNSLEEMEMIVSGERFRLSFSYGVVEAEEKYTSLEDMIKEADELMYQNKRSKNL